MTEQEEFDAETERLIQELEKEGNQNNQDNKEEDKEEEAEEEQSEDQPEDNDENQKEGGENDIEEEEDDISEEDKGSPVTEKLDNDPKEEGQPLTLMVRGVEVQFDSLEELITAANSKLSSPTKREDSFTENLVSQGKISERDLKLLADLRGGKAEALAQLAKDHSINLEDTYDIESYEPAFEVTQKSNMETLVDNITSNEQWSKQYNDFAGIMPAEFMSEIISDPNKFAVIADHTQSGVYKDILPIAMKKHMAGETMLNAYAAAAQEYTTSKQTGTQLPEKKIVTTKQQQIRNKIISKPKSGSRKKKITADNIYDMSEVDFQKYINEQG